MISDTALPSTPDPVASLRGERRRAHRRAVDLSRPRQPGRHLLVSVRRSGADGPRRRPAPPPVRSRAMSPLAPALQAYFTDRLIGQRAASPNTIGAYKVTFRLLLGLRRQPNTARRPAPSTSQTSTRRWSPRSWTTSNATGATARPPATTAWPRSTRCSATWPYGIPSTPPLSSGCSPSRPSEPNATSSPTSPIPRPTRCWAPAIRPPGPAGATTPCSP